MPQEIKVSATSTVPTMAIVVPFVLGVTQPLLAWALICGFRESWAAGDMTKVCISGFFLLMEFIMLPACWLLFFWFLFGSLRLGVEHEQITLTRCLFGLRLHGKSIPMGAQSYFRLMTRLVMNQSMRASRPGETCTQKEFEIGVADAQKFYPITNFHNRNAARELLCKLHKAYPALPADEDGTPVTFTP